MFRSMVAQLLVSDRRLQLALLLQPEPLELLRRWAGLLAARRATASGGACPAAMATVAAEEIEEEDAAERGASVLMGPAGWRRGGCLVKGEKTLLEVEGEREWRAAG